MYEYKRTQCITSINFFHQATTLHFTMVLSWLEIMASFMADSKVNNLDVQVVAMISIESKQASLQ